MKKITIYSTPWCHFCHAAKEYLDSKKIAYTDIDVSKDQVKAQEMIDKSGQMGVPVIDIDGKIVVGFDREKIDELIS
jgi:glutaredoxin-like YruB-family protein